jgi:hypothetical protein
MKKLIAASILLMVILSVAALAEPAKDPYSLPIKNLYSAPDENSNLILAFPIDVKVLDISADSNWYKVRIAYRIGPLSYTYIGWAEVPVGEIMADRQKQLEKVAKVPETVAKDLAPAETETPKL